MDSLKNSKKGRRKIKFIITAFTIVLVFLALNFINKKVVYADSGFDFDYDSGSDWGGSSGWDSDSSWDSDDDYYYSGSTGRSGSSGGSGSGSILGMVTVILIIIIIVIVAMVLSSNKDNSVVQRTSPYIKVDDSDIENKIIQYIPNFNKEAFLIEGFEIYMDVQRAWMNFNLEDVRGKITDELFNMYQSQLDTLEVKGQQNIMKGFELVTSHLKDVNMQNNNITITACYIVDFYDYIVEKTTGKVLRGSASTKMRVTYDMKFRKALNNELVIDHCPNCGAKIENMNGAGVCEYCGSKIVSENSNWVLTDKKTINQRRA